MKTTGRWVWAVAITAALFSAPAVLAVKGGQVDDFTGGTTAGWREGGPSPNPPTNVAGGGPAGVGDAYLQNTSSGGFGAGSRMVMFNTTQWTGDYLAAGVLQIEVDMANLGSTVLEMRIAIIGGSNTQFGSTNGVMLPADGSWRPLVFELTSSSLTLLQGGDSLATVLASVSELRILHSDSPSFQADPINATLGVDNITASQVPVELQTFTVD